MFCCLIVYILFMYFINLTKIFLFIPILTMFKDSQGSIFNSSQNSTNANGFTPFFCQPVQQRNFFDIISGSSMSSQGMDIFNQQYEQSQLSFSRANYNQHQDQDHQDAKTYEYTRSKKSKSKSDAQSIINQLRDYNFDQFQEDDCNCQNQNVYNKIQSFHKSKLVDSEAKNKNASEGSNNKKTSHTKKQSKSYVVKQNPQNLSKYEQNWNNYNQKLKGSIVSYRSSLNDYPETIFQEEYSKQSNQLLSEQLKANEQLIHKNSEPFCQSIVRQFNSDFVILNKGFKSLRVEQKQNQTKINTQLEQTKSNSQNAQKPKNYLRCLKKNQIVQQQPLSQAQSQGLIYKPKKFEFKPKKFEIKGSKKQLPKNLNVVVQKQNQQSQNMEPNQTIFKQIKIDDHKSLKVQSTSEQNRQCEKQHLHQFQTDSYSSNFNIPNHCSVPLSFNTIPSIPKMSFKFNLRKSRIQQNGSKKGFVKQSIIAQVQPKVTTQSKQLQNFRKSTGQISKLFKNQEPVQQSIYIQQTMLNSLLSTKQKQQFVMDSNQEVKESITRPVNKYQNKADKEQTNKVLAQEVSRNLIKKPVHQFNLKTKRFTLLNKDQKINQLKQIPEFQTVIQKQRYSDSSFELEDSLIDTKGIADQVKEKQNNKQKQGKFQFKKSSKIYNNLKIERQNKDKTIANNEENRAFQAKTYNNNKIQDKANPNQRYLIDISVTTPKIVKNNGIVSQHFTNFQKTERQRQKRSRSNSTQKLLDQLDNLFQMRDSLKTKRERLKTQYSQLSIFASSISRRMRQKLGKYID